MCLCNISPSQFVSSYLSLSTHFHVLIFLSIFLSACLTITTTVSISSYSLSMMVNRTRYTFPQHILCETYVYILLAAVMSFSHISPLHLLFATIPSITLFALLHPWLVSSSGVAGIAGYLISPFCPVCCGVLFQTRLCHISLTRIFPS